MRVAVLGAGAIGPAWAVLARQRGHEATLWSPSGAGLAGYAGTLHAEGAVTASLPVGAPVLGPVSMASRYVTEDVAFGLCFWQELARRAGLATPTTDATVAALDVLWGRSFAAANDLRPVLAMP